MSCCLPSPSTLLPLELSIRFSIPTSPVSPVATLERVSTIELAVETAKFLLVEPSVSIIQFPPQLSILLQCLIPSRSEFLLILPLSFLPVDLVLQFVLQFLRTLALPVTSPRRLSQVPEFVLEPHDDLLLPFVPRFGLPLDPEALLLCVVQFLPERFVLLHAQVDFVAVCQFEVFHLVLALGELSPHFNAPRAIWGFPLRIEGTREAAGRGGGGTWGRVVLLRVRKGMCVDGSVVAMEKALFRGVVTIRVRFRDALASPVSLQVEITLDL